MNGERKGTIMGTSKVSDRTKLVMEEGSVIGDYVLVSCDSLTMLAGAQVDQFVEMKGRARVVMGKRSTIASHCSIQTSSDTAWGYMNDSVPEEDRRVETGDILLGNDVYIGPHSTIMPGVTIGDGAVIGAYSYITSDVRPWQKVHPPKLRQISVLRMVEVDMPNYPVEEKRKVEEKIYRKWER